MRRVPVSDLVHHALAALLEVVGAALLVLSATDAPTALLQTGGQTMAGSIDQLAASELITRLGLLALFSGIVVAALTMVLILLRRLASPGVARTIRIMVWALTIAVLAEAGWMLMR
ncbi:hypothetical protein [Pseudoclavibacter caeni]|jgi:hypothetical protein|uniref:Uncharacterized protein n=1 Tax=Pseudoclavibacter caeni TaxID=908846 RepID=A0A7C8FPP4_9MICO|nr:hypothetical protein [Pseudoclavibacter caeni]KAB1631659.1 hypothetical protein F8O02_06855 [Pseudoclavibacter caeni]NYJ97282.1 hypothetical protein [Pseudoclavibacter caeni]